MIMEKSDEHVHERTQRREDAKKAHYVKKVKVKVTMLKRCGKDVNAPNFNMALLMDGCEHGRRAH